MILATLGWGLWWFVLGLHRFAPSWFPGLTPVYIVTGCLASVGLFLGIFTVRAGLIWVLLAAVPIFANASLLMLPLVVGDDVVEVLDEGE